MSTMKGEFVEKATTQFISSKVFPLIDRDIADGKETDLERLLRPIGFNVVLSACFGKTLESVDDPLCVGWEQIVARHNGQKIGQSVAIIMASLMTGRLPDLESKVSIALQTLFAGPPDLVQGMSDQVDFVAKLENAKDVDAEKDENVRLFSDFVDDYVKMEDGKYTKKQLLGDMMVMFLGAGDTTYSALTFALLTIARQQKLQQELHEEIVQAFGDDVAGIILKGGLSKIPKLRAFIQLRCPLVNLLTIIILIKSLFHIQRDSESVSSISYDGIQTDCG